MRRWDIFGAPERGEHRRPPFVARRSAVGVRRRAGSWQDFGKTWPLRKAQNRRKKRFLGTCEKHWVFEAKRSGGVTFRGFIFRVSGEGFPGRKVVF